MREQKCRPDYSLISKYRPLLMGVAILLIVFCHLDVAQRHNGAEHTRLAGILQTGSVGVDIFLLLSGIGLYYSFSKNHLPYLKFETKRILRILPPYLAIGGTTYLIYDLLIRHFSVGKFLRDLFFVSWLRDSNTRYWYVLAILVFYLLFPALYSFVHGRSRALLRTSLFCALWWIAAEILCQSVDRLYTVRIALQRLPIFLIGIYAGKLCREKQEIKRSHLVLYVILGFTLLALQKKVLHSPLSSYLHYPIRGALAVSIIAAVIIIMETLEKRTPRLSAVISKAFVWLGGLTYELYLLHQSCLILFEYPYKPFSYFLVAFVLPLIAAAGIFLVRKRMKTRREA